MTKSTAGSAIAWRGRRWLRDEERRSNDDAGGESRGMRGRISVTGHYVSRANAKALRQRESPLIAVGTSGFAYRYAKIYDFPASPTKGRSFAANSGALFAATSQTMR